MTLAFITHPQCLRHDAGQGHPESAARLNAINDQLVASRLDILLRHHQAPRASRDQIMRVHDADYVEYIFNTSPIEGYVRLDPDTVMSPDTLLAARYAAGAVVMGVDLVMRGETDRVFCSIRPPGHHAEHDKAMGFCIFNNVAIGAAHALEKYNLKRVAIVDFDVHHGNGTEDIFYEEQRIFYCSSFQHPLYPFSNIGDQPQNVMDVPLAAGASGTAFRNAIIQSWLPALDKFKPEIILCSAGFDAHMEDPLADLNLNDEDYFWVTQQISYIADKYARGRIVSVLEGGYALQALGRSVAAHIKALIER